MVNLVSEDDEGSIVQLLHTEERIELGLCFGKTLVVLGVDEEDNAADLGEVVAPETTSLCVAAEIKGCELDVADGELFGGWDSLAEFDGRRRCGISKSMDRSFIDLRVEDKLTGM